MAAYLSPLSCELLSRLHQEKNLGGAVYGQIAQQIIAAGLAKIYASDDGTFVEQPGAGVPDCRANLGEERGLFYW